MKINTKAFALLAAFILLADRGLTGSGMKAAAEPAPTRITAAPAIRRSAVSAPPVPTAVGESYTDKSDGGHALTVDGETAAYSNITVSKTGDADGEEAGSDGANAAVLAANGGELTLRASSVTTDGTGANAVFSHGEGTVINVADSTITTLGSCSGGVVAAGGSAMNTDNLVIHTYGVSSPAIQANRGSGAVYVSGGTYSTDGEDSPAIYSAADVSVSDAELSATASQVAAVEGGSSVRLENVTLTANSGEKQRENAARSQAVTFCQSAAGNADEGAADFTMLGGSLTNLRGDLFSVSGTDALIQLCKAEIVNDDPDGIFLRAAAVREDGSRVELRAAAQTIDGDMLVDGDSALNLYLGEGAVFTGAVQTEAGGKVYVELDDDGKWSLTGDSNIDSLRCRADSVTLNGFTLTVGGEAYVEGTAMTGSPVGAGDLA